MNDIEKEFDDAAEWNSTLDLLLDGNDTVASELSIGTVVTLQQELFHKMIEEINTSRIKNGDLAEGVELIMVGEADEEDSDVSVED